MTAMSQDRMTDDMYAWAARIRELSDDDLAAVIDDAAKDYGNYALWPDLPTNQQGSRGPDARSIREGRRIAARELWLTGRTEQQRRRDAR